jgi:hypothetical protein
MILKILLNFLDKNLKGKICADKYDLVEPRV